MKGKPSLLFFVLGYEAEEPGQIVLESPSTIHHHHYYRNIKGTIVLSLDEQIRIQSLKPPMYRTTPLAPLIILAYAAMALAGQSSSAGGLQPVARAVVGHSNRPRSLALAPRATAADAEALGLAIPAKCKA